MWLLLGCIGRSYAQTVTITDQQTGKLLESVVLISESPQASTITNAKGQADISDLQRAEKIHIRILGYETKVLSYVQFELPDFKIGLEASDLNLDEVVVSATRWRQASGNVPSKFDFSLLKILKKRLISIRKRVFEIMNIPFLA